MPVRSSVCLLALFALASKFALGQTPSPAPTATPAEDKRIFWIIPNYRTAPIPSPYEPLIPREKFKIASEDAFDRGTVALAVLFAGEAQLTNSTPAFGQGVKGYAQYLGTAYGDLVIGDMMTEAIYPVIASSGPALFSARDGYRLVTPGECNRSDLLDPHRFWSYAVQFFGDRRQFNCSSHFNRILSKQPDCRRCSLQTRCAAGGRHGVKHFEGVLA